MPETPEKARLRRANVLWNKLDHSSTGESQFTEDEAFQAIAICEAHATQQALEVARDACGRCKGSGVYMNDYCSMCDDSTCDHECDDPVETECHERQCQAIRALLAALPEAP